MSEPVNEQAQERPAGMRPLVIWVAEDVQRTGDAVEATSGRWKSFVGEFEGDFLVMICMRVERDGHLPDGHTPRKDARLVRRMVRAVWLEAQALFTRAGG